MSGNAAINKWPTAGIPTSTSWSSDMVLDLVNSTPAPVAGAVEVASTFSTNTAGNETSVTVHTFMLNGTKVLGLTHNGNGLIVPGGATQPSLQFAAPAAGGNVGYGYDDNQPALLWYINSRKHLMYGNALLMDPGAAVSGGFFLDQGQAGGLGFSASGATVFLQGGGLQGMAITANTVALGPNNALNTLAITGHVYINSCAGAPTGVPTGVTGKNALIYDTTNNKIWVYNGAWRGIVVV